MGERVGEARVTISIGGFPKASSDKTARVQESHSSIFMVARCLMEVAALLWVSRLVAPGQLLGGISLGALCSWFWEICLCGKEKRVKSSCFALRHVLVFPRITYCLSSKLLFLAQYLLGWGGWLNHQKLKSKIHLGWDFPVSLELWTLRPTGQGFGSGARRRKDKIE